MADNTTKKPEAAINDLAAGQGMSREAQLMGLKPTDATYFYNKALKFYKDGRHHEAVSAGLVAVSCDAFVAEHWLILGLAQAQVFERKEALKCFEKVVELDPESIDGWTNLGEILLYEYQHDRAAAALKTAIALDAKAEHPAGRRARVLTLTQSLWDQADTTPQGPAGASAADAKKPKK